MQGHSSGGCFRALAACAALIALFYALAWFSFRAHSATIDEPLHALGAYFHVFEHDYRVNPEDPPLWNYWAMLPHHAGELAPDHRTDLWEKQLRDVAYQFEVTTCRLYGVPGNDGAAFINSSRAMMLLIGAALAAALAAWSWQLAGPTGAIVACTLYCLDPNFLAHAPLVKNDVSISFIMLCFAWVLWSIGRRARTWNILLLSLLCGAAVTIKFSGIILAPMLIAGLLMRALLPASWPFLRIELRGRSARLAAAAGVAALCAIVSWTLIWASYGFRYDPTPIPGARLNFASEQRRLADNLFFLRRHRWPTTAQAEALPPSAIQRLVSWADDHRLLPQAWLFGFLYTYRSTLVRETYLLGEYSSIGWWYYFPLAMLFKTPVATLASFAAGLAVWPVFRLRRSRDRGLHSACANPAGEDAAGAAENAGCALSSLSFASRTLDPWTLGCLLIPLVIYGYSALTSNLNLGLRHVLPIYPFLYLLVAIAAGRAGAMWPRAFMPVALVLAVGLAVESLVAFPHYISFFNAPSRPHRLYLLSDSNFDWGQDLTYVAEWQQDHRLTTLYLGYWGSADPAFYGIRYINIPGGFVLGPEYDLSVLSELQSGGGEAGGQPAVLAISATLLQGVNVPPSLREHYRPLRQATPRAILGDTIYLYDWPLKNRRPKGG